MNEPSQPAPTDSSTPTGEFAAARLLEGVGLEPAVAPGESSGLVGVGGVCLLQCSRQRCGHVLTEDEYVWTPDPAWPSSKIALCPKCAGESFYTLNARGQARKSSDTGPREINPADIEPSPKMGLKMKRRILAAKRRALGGGGAELVTKDSGDTQAKPSNEQSSPTPPLSAESSARKEQP